MEVWYQCSYPDDLVRLPKLYLRQFWRFFIADEKVLEIVQLGSHISSHSRTVFHHLQHGHTVSAGVRPPGGQLWPVYSCLWRWVSSYLIQPWWCRWMVDAGCWMVTPFPLWFFLLLELHVASVVLSSFSLVSDILSSFFFPFLQPIEFN